jgi:hypothetical protein
MQKGKVYPKGASWWFRYRTPVVVDGQKKWTDAYEKLCPVEQFASVKAVQAEFGGRIRELLGGAASLTTGTMQPVNDFVEKVYFPGKEGVLRPSTLVGYKDFYNRHFKLVFKDRRMCDVKLPIRNRFWTASPRRILTFPPVY